MARVTLDELFEEARQKRLAEIAAEDADPVFQQLAAERRARNLALIDAEIELGLRDENGEWIETDEPEDEDEEDFEEDDDE